MKTVSKKLLCLLMVVFLLAAAIPFQAFAATTGGTLTVECKENGVIVETLTATDPTGLDTPEGIIAFVENGLSSTQYKDYAVTLEPADATFDGTTKTITANLSAPAPKVATKYNVTLNLLENGNKVANSVTIQRDDGATINSGKTAIRSFFKEFNDQYTFNTFTDETGVQITFPLTVDGDKTINANVTFAIHTLTITIGGAVKDSTTMPTKASEPVTKTALDNAVLGKIGADKYIISAYYTAAGSPELSDYKSLNSGDKAIYVEVALKDAPSTDPAQYINLTLDAKDGTIDGTYTSQLKKDATGVATVSSLPNASKAGYKFVGWFVGDKRLEVGAKLSADTTAVAKYELLTKNLLVKGVKTTQNAEDSVLISEYNVPIGNQLLAFLNQPDVTSAVRSSVPTGYSLMNNNGVILWYTSNGKDYIGQEKATDQAQTVLVKYQPNTYTLYFQVDGGSVSPTSKQVTYDQKVGTLPTPTRKGDVFLGWFDENNVQYTKDTVYKVAGHTTLTAHWQSEATVLLRIYLDSNLNTADRIVDITGKVVGNSVKQSEVEKIVLKYYSAQPGKKMTLVGLFDDATWEGYKNGTVKTDTNVAIQENAITNVYVVVKNGQQGGTSSTTSTTKPVDKTNPKTGDTMMIYAAASAMVVAAAALVTVQAIRKKKQF